MRNTPRCTTPQADGMTRPDLKPYIYLIFRAIFSIQSFIVREMIFKYVTVSFSFIRCKIISQRTLKTLKMLSRTRCDRNDDLSLVSYRRCVSHLGWFPRSLNHTTGTAHCIGYQFNMDIFCVVKQQCSLFC